MRRLLLLSALLILCACAAPQTHTAGLKAFKGWELYSWQTLAGRNYALLQGTNRNKTRAEITAPENTITGEAALIAKLAALAQGEQIFFNTTGEPGFSLPPSDSLRQIEAACAARSLILSR